MSEKISLFSELKEQSSGQITLGDKGKCNIIGVGKVGSDLSHTINDVYLVDGLKFNLLSVSQVIVEIRLYLTRKNAQFKMPNQEEW